MNCNWLDSISVSHGCSELQTEVIVALWIVLILLGESDSDSESDSESESEGWWLGDFSAKSIDKCDEPSDRN